VDFAAVTARLNSLRKKWLLKSFSENCEAGIDFVALTARLQQFAEKVVVKSRANPSG